MPLSSLSIGDTMLKILKENGLAKLYNGHRNTPCDIEFVSTGRTLKLCRFP